MRLLSVSVLAAALLISVPAIAHSQAAEAVSSEAAASEFSEASLINTCASYENFLRRYPGTGEGYAALTRMIDMQCPDAADIGAHLGMFVEAAPAAAEAAAPNDDTVIVTGSRIPLVPWFVFWPGVVLAFAVSLAAALSRANSRWLRAAAGALGFGALWAALDRSLVRWIDALISDYHWYPSDFAADFFAPALSTLLALGIGALVWWRRPHRQMQAAAPARDRSQGPRELQPAGFHTAPDVFLSYKRDERAQIVAISERLDALNISVWFDAEMHSGTTFDAEIEKQVRAAKCVLVCWSPGAVASEWVRAEATIGRQRGVLAAAILKDCDLPPPFNLVHAEDLRAGIGPQNPEWLKVLERIGALVGRPGLAGFEAASAGPDRAALAAWMADYPHDPLFDRAVALLKT